MKSLALMLVSLTCLTSGFAGCQGKPSDDWQRTWILETDKLPLTESSDVENDSRTDSRMMAAVGNGHVATVLYDPAVYMNGLYNGPVGWTHRAAIQTIHDVRVDVEGADVTRSYALDMWRAVFTETIRAPGLEIKVMTYAHQRLVQLLVTEIHVTRADSRGEKVTLRLDRSHMNSTVDLGIVEPRQVNNISGCRADCLHTHGETHITETPEAEVGRVHVYWTEIPPSLTVSRDQRARRWLFFSSYDREESKARRAFERGWNLRSLTPGLLLETHETAWAERWRSGRIDVEGDDELATVVHSSLYYILLSLPSERPELPLEQFYGLSPGSLARGANWTDYQGHVFWDMETWMYPPILALFPRLARAMLSYRIHGGEGARAKARSYGYEGWQFPWESAFTGYEMTPLICVPCREYEQHITGDVAFAARQYWAATRDARWLWEEGGARLVTRTAAFWADRARYDAAKDRYDIDGVMPPDEHAQHVNNSIYTNFVAKLNLLTASYLSCLEGQPVSGNTTAASDRRLEIAQKLYMVFNDSGRYHPEYEGYDNVQTAWDNNQVVKQADTVMLGYPLGMEMDDQVRRNDLTLYGQRGDPGGPAMTWSMFAINWLDLGETDLAAENFNKSYQWYTRKPFNVWTEVKSGFGASNFITGMGGFLQAVLFGYGGLRVELERLTFDPRPPPPGARRLRVTGLDYLGGSLDLLVTAGRVLIVVRETAPEFPLQLRVRSSGTTWRLRAGMEIVLRREPFEVSTLNMTECPLPQGSSCPDVARGDDSQGREPLMPAHVGTVHVRQTGGGRCGDFLRCSRLVEQFMSQDDTVNFYIGDDSRVYQGASIASTAGTLRVSLLGDYTLQGMSMEQHALLRRLIKCGIERSNIDPEYKLQYGAERAEDCGVPPCAGNSLHCQLKEWRHWDPANQGMQPDCSRLSEGLSTSIPTPHPTPDPLPTSPASRCPPALPVQVTCDCRSRGVRSGAARGVASLALSHALLAAILVTVSADFFGGFCEVVSGQKVRFSYLNILLFLTDWLND